MNSDFPPDPKELDKELAKWGYGLSNFTHVLAEILCGFWEDHYLGIKISSVEKEITTIEKLKKDIIDSLRLYLDKYPELLLLNYQGLKSQEQKKWIMRVFKLNEFFSRIDSMNDPLRDIIEDEYLLCKKSGTHIVQRNKIAAVWAKAMKNSWIDIAKLLKWFYKKLEHTSYGDKICIGNDEKKEKEKLRTGSYYLKEKYPDALDLYFRTFFNESIQKTKLHTFHSIVFGKDSIKIVRSPKLLKPMSIPWPPKSKHKPQSISSEWYCVYKMKFIGKKKIYSDSTIDISSLKQLPHISFPNGEKFYLPTSR